MKDFTDTAVWYAAGSQGRRCDGTSGTMFDRLNLGLRSGLSAAWPQPPSCKSLVSLVSRILESLKPTTSWRGVEHDECPQMD